MQPVAFDVVIVGGGIMGSASAYSLMKADPRLKVAVVEKDPAYTQASTTLSMSNVRVQFSLKENIQISQYAFDVLASFEQEMAVGDRKPRTAFRNEGNLFLVDADGRASAQAALGLQKELGCPVAWWTPEQIRQHYPLYSTEGYQGGTFGSRDGHFDAYGVLMGYKVKARSLGAVYLHDEVTGILIRKGRVQGVSLKSANPLIADWVIN